MAGLHLREFKRAAWQTACVSALLLSPTIAKADFPGEMWSVERVSVSVASEVAYGNVDAATLESRVRQGLHKANQIYFYGTHPVRMDVKVLSADTMSVTIRDQLTGALLGHTGRINLADNPGDVRDIALAWMDGLECTGSNCAGSAGPVIAAAPTSVPSAPLQVTSGSSSETLPETAIVTVAKAGPADFDTIPVPVAAPHSRVVDATVTVARNPNPSDYATIRIARFNLANVAQFSYAATDPISGGNQGTLVSSSGIAAPVQSDDGSTAVGRFFSRLGQFLGLVDEPARTVSPVAQPAVQGARVVLTNPGASSGSAVRASAPVQPVPSFGIPQPEVTSTQQIQQIAALAPSGSVGAGIVRIPSPGLGLPTASEALPEQPDIAPIRVASVTPQRARNEPFSIRLDPGVLSQATPEAVDQLLGAYGNPARRLQLVASGDESGGRSGVDRILSSRGLILADDLYAKAERVYWSGNSGSRGYWVNVPGGVPSRFVLIAGRNASVIASVHNQGGAVQVSDAVASALGMRAGGWSDIQVIALRQASTTAEQRSRTRRQ